MLVLPAFFPFPTLFSKAFSFRAVKGKDCGNELKQEQCHHLDVPCFYKMSKFLHNNEDNADDTKAIAIPWNFSKNSRAKNITDLDT